MLRGPPGRGNGRAFGQRSACNVFPDNGLRGPVPALELRSFPTTISARGGYATSPVPWTMRNMKRLIAPSLVIVICGMAAAREQGPGAEVTSKAIAKLEARLGESEIEVDEVRVTDAGIACIDYHSTSPGNRQAHAVLQGEELLISTSADHKKRFEKAWSEHCLGPRGGATPNQ